MISPGDLLLVAGESNLSKAIERLSDSPYSHAAVVLCPFHDTWLILQAWTFGVEIVPMSRAQQQFSGPVDVFRPRQVLDLAAFQKQALDLVGHPYDYLGIVRLLFLILFQGRKRARARKTSTLFCSETAQICYRAGGVKTSDLPDQCVEPGDLARSRAFEYTGTLNLPTGELT